jgi:hypothetical protein
VGTPAPTRRSERDSRRRLRRSRQRIADGTSSRGSRHSVGNRTEVPFRSAMTVNAPFDVAAFLDEPRRPAQVASVSPSGSPVLGSFWFLFAQSRFWFSSRRETPLPIAVAHGAEVAVIVDDFSPPTSIRQVRVRGDGHFETHDAGMVERIYRRYLGTGVEGWPEFFRDRLVDPDWGLWTVTPTSGLVVTSPDFDPREVRWEHPTHSPLPRQSM